MDFIEHISFSQARIKATLCGNEINEVTGLNDPQKVQVQAAHGRGADPTALPANIAVVYRSTHVL